MTLYPVVMAVPEAGLRPRGREQVARLSRIARKALQLSAERSGVVLGDLLKDEDDVPIPFDGTFWSLSHKPKCVAAVVSSERAGIDVEEVKPRSPGLFDPVASDEEWEVGGGKSWDVFFRYWTAKEATLKALGVGTSGLKACRVTAVPDNLHVALEYRCRPFTVEQLRCGNHIVSVLQGDSRIEWVISNGTHAAVLQRCCRQEALPAVRPERLEGRVR